MKKEPVLAIVIGFVAVILLATSIIQFDTIMTLRTDAIKSGAAYYHPETGHFTWRHKK